ncbi:DNA (cytosine-5)-methyltransferase 1 [Luteibacter sp. Sphag1AF]|uniref:DNA cytosine methyltransferase n=1 Tax=Luteibacter sp. Sphag1AF TaxID=2587031 RepID=UPI00161612B8|nr:DNA cytosine methyltransferase [Luteibacter sp. Sphag1AF]MBB3227839.1 DNA (cytosine-5)-methyltransferase 1 [Luteibacter sp. Sphag1AF]
MSKSVPVQPVWSLFSGAYGLDLGLERGGIKATLAVDVDQACCETLRLNRPDLDVWQADVATLSGAQLRERTQEHGEIFAIVGGPPCQSFSTGGKRSGLSDPRGNLIYEYLRIVNEVRPRFFVLENVASILTAALKHRPIAERPGKHWSLKRYASGTLNESSDEALALDPDELSGSAIRQIFNDVKAIGYTPTFSVVNAADFGAPQARMRFVMICSRDNVAIPSLTPTHGEPGSDLLPYATVRQAIEDLQGDPGQHSSYTPEVRRFFEKIPEGKNWRALPVPLQKEALGGSFESGGGKTGFYRRLPWDAPAPTIVGRPNRKGSALCHPVATRPLSVHECARLQGFPDTWKFWGSMSQQYLQIGNAVPLALGEVVGKALLEASKRPPGKRRANVRIDTMLAESLAHLRSKARNKVARGAVAAKKTAGKGKLTSA